MISDDQVRAEIAYLDPDKERNDKFRAAFRYLMGMDWSPISPDASAMPWEPEYYVSPQMFWPYMEGK